MVVGKSAAIVGGRLVKRNAGQLLLQSHGASVQQVQQRTFISVVHKYAEAVKRYGWKGTLWRLYNPGDVKFGKYVGSDYMGNKYYEDPTDLAGQQRWTEFHVESFDDFESTHIPPEWHAWLSYTTDDKPGDEGQKPENWIRVPLTNHSDNPYKTHLGPVGTYKMNQTQLRARGYGIGNMETTWDVPDQMYLQPGHPLRNRNRKAFHEIDYNNPHLPEPHEPLRSLSLP